MAGRARGALAIARVAEALKASYASIRRWHAEAVKFLGRQLRSLDITGVPAATIGARLDRGTRLRPAEPSGAARRCSPRRNSMTAARRPASPRGLGAVRTRLALPQRQRETDDVARQ